MIYRGTGRLKSNGEKNELKIKWPSLYTGVEEVTQEHTAWKIMPAGMCSLPITEWTAQFGFTGVRSGLPEKV